MATTHPDFATRAPHGLRRRCTFLAVTPSASDADDTNGGGWGSRIRSRKDSKRDAARAEGIV